MTSKTRRVWTLVLSGSCVAALSGGILSGTSESMLRASFASALEQTAAPSMKVATGSGPISGSEDFWLTSNGQVSPISANKTVSVGDKISLDIGGEHRTLEVAKISEYWPQITEIDTTGHPSRFVMVTARDAADPTSRPIRLVIELEQDGATLAKNHAGRTL